MEPKRKHIATKCFTNNHKKQNNGELITIPYSKSIRLEPIAFDMEYNNKEDLLPVQMAFCSLDGVVLYNRFINCGKNLEPYKLEQLGQEQETFDNAVTIDEIIRFLKSFLRDKFVIGWKISNDIIQLKRFDQDVENYFGGTADCMVDYSNRYGDYSYEHDNRTWVGLKKAAKNFGYADDRHHRADFDAQKVAFVWNKLQKENQKVKSLSGSIIDALNSTNDGVPF